MAVDSVDALSERNAIRQGGQGPQGPDLRDLRDVSVAMKILLAELQCMSVDAQGRVVCTKLHQKLKHVWLQGYILCRDGDDVVDLGDGSAVMSLDVGGLIASNPDANAVLQAGRYVSCVCAVEFHPEEGLLDLHVDSASPLDDPGDSLAEPSWFLEACLACWFNSSLVDTFMLVLFALHSALAGGQVAGKSSPASPRPSGAGERSAGINPAALLESPGRAGADLGRGRQIAAHDEGIPRGPEAEAAPEAAGVGEGVGAGVGPRAPRLRDFDGICLKLQTLELTTLGARKIRGAESVWLQCALDLGDGLKDILISCPSAGGRLLTIQHTSFHSKAASAELRSLASLPLQLKLLLGKGEREGAPHRNRGRSRCSRLPRPSCCGLRPCSSRGASVPSLQSSPS
ncbi:unnamed protein product [Symbiodinium natans]|uniref:Uncharacterized protein n=1 Tax=Symbiodinium natans TaxID=878477 RepID=A0A812RV07_9DINO|nr:unnamed protein product [Symbiodinium natans]